MLFGPASFSAKHPKITQRFLSLRGVFLIEYVIMSATSKTDCLVGRTASSKSSVITLGPIGCLKHKSFKKNLKILKKENKIYSIGTTRISDLTNCIQPTGLSVMSCSCTMEFGGSGSLNILNKN